MTTPQATADVFIVGGGVNGAGIARDAAGRGLSVVLCEQADLAEWTSSRSGKLVHGGLRYLEYYEFRLVREALIEREVLLESAPHIIWPMRFVLPHSPLDRPAWLIRLGLFLYDHLGGRRRLPGTRTLNLRTAPEGKPLRAEFTKGFEYSDCWVDDARLVVLNALAAKENGASILTRTTFVSAEREQDIWRIRTENQHGQTAEFTARTLVNAAGPWVNHIINKVSRANSVRRVRLVKGSHIIVPKFWTGDHAYLVQNADRRVIFINPYEGNLALVGTTDIPQEGEPDAVEVDDDEVRYLIETIRRYFDTPISASDVVSSFSGVRPLFDDNAENPSAVTRDYVIDVDGNSEVAPLVSVFGGKITTFRKLAEHTLEKMRPWLPTMTGAWTRSASLPGGDIPNADFATFCTGLIDRYPKLPEIVLRHLARLYGTKVDAILDGVKEEGQLGARFSDAFYEREARYLIENEWALSVEDVLTRRTKHGLHMGAEQKSNFKTWFESALSEKA